MEPESIGVTVKPQAYRGTEVLNWNIHVLLRDEPDFVAMRRGPYHKVPMGSGGTFYATVMYPFVDYKLHNPKSQEGYGGAVYRFPLIDGTIDMVKGPWSSRASVYNMLVSEDYSGMNDMPLATEVAVHVESWKNLGLSTNVAVDWLQKQLDWHLYGWELETEVRADGEINFDITPFGGRNRSFGQVFAR